MLQPITITPDASGSFYQIAQADLQVLINNLVLTTDPNGQVISAQLSSNPIVYTPVDPSTIQAQADQLLAQVTATQTLNTAVATAFPSMPAPTNP